MDEIVQHNESSLSEDFVINVIGYSEDTSESVKQLLQTTVENISTLVPLNNLEGITIGINYKDALCHVQKTIVSQTEEFQPTDIANIGKGAGMAIPIDRSGVLKTHIVFGPMLVTAMCNSVPGKANELTYDLLYHELAHSVGNEIKYRSFGQDILSRTFDHMDSLEQFLWKLSHHVWDEYFACRLGCILSQAKPSKDELFFPAYENFRQIIRKQRIRYHQYFISLNEFIDVFSDQIRLLLLSVAYVLGENDAARKQECPQSKAYIFISEHCQEFLVPFHDILKTLWKRNGKWDSIEELSALNYPTLKLLESLEIYPTVHDTGNLYFDVPVRYLL